MMIPIRHAEGESLRQSEADHAFNFVILTTIAAGVLALVYALAGWLLAVSWDTLKLGASILLFLFSLAVLMIVFLGWRRGRQHLKDVIDQYVADSNQRREIEQERIKWERLRLDLELEEAYLKLDRANTTPLLPSTTVPLTQHTDPKLPEMIGGFDVGDIERLCELFAIGGRWSESALIGTKLPITGEVLTPERYRLLIDGVFVAKGVIGYRDGDKRKTGVLLIKDADQMMKAIRPSQPPTLLNANETKTTSGQ